MSDLILCPKCDFPIALEGGTLIGGYRLCCPDCEWESNIYQTEDEALTKGTTEDEFECKDCKHVSIHSWEDLGGNWHSVLACPVVKEYEPRPGMDGCQMLPK